MLVKCAAMPEAEDAMAQNGQGPQEAAQIVTQRALQTRSCRESAKHSVLSQSTIPRLGARSNLTCIVMRLGWAKLPS